MRRYKNMETSMNRRIVLQAAGLAAAALLGAGPALAQGFPARSITLVVPNPPGGVVDTAARLASDPLSRLLGQSVVVDNRGGASGNIAYQMVARAPKDGYTLLASYSAYHVGNPALFPRLPWAQSELAPVGLIVAATNVIAVHPSVPANNLQEFIAYLRKNPGKVNYASQGNGSLSHVGTAVFAQVTQDVLGGQVQMFITTPPSVLGHVQTGKLRALAVTSKARHPMLPDVPTTAEAGLPGFELEAWVGLFAPAGTPPDVIDRLSAALKTSLESPDVQKRAALQGVEPRFLGPQALGALVQRETDHWGKVIKANHITVD
jgi:tripartite-type tricarboxylate transporter receptor subunit TctC